MSIDLLEALIHIGMIVIPCVVGVVIIKAIFDDYEGADE